MGYQPQNEKLKLLEENIGDYPHDLKGGKIFKSQKIIIKQKFDKFDFIKTYNLSKNISLKIFFKITLGKNIHSIRVKRTCTQNIFFPTTK